MVVKDLAEKDRSKSAVILLLDGVALLTAWILINEMTKAVMQHSPMDVLKLQ